MQRHATCPKENPSPETQSSPSSGKRPKTRLARVPGTKPNIRRSRICGYLLQCSCGFQSFAGAGERACVCLWAKSFAYALMHAYLAAAPPTWTCHTIYVCAKYGATSHFYLWALCAAICYMYACVKNTTNTEMLCNTFEMYIPPPPTHTQVCISYTIYIVSLAAGHSNEMATNGDISMISPPTSSISNDQDPFGQLPPLPPPLRSTQVLQPLSVFPGAETIKLHLYSCNCSPVSICVVVAFAVFVQFNLLLDRAF